MAHSLLTCSKERLCMFTSLTAGERVQTSSMASAKTARKKFLEPISESVPKCIRLYFQKLWTRDCPVKRNKYHCPLLMKKSTRDHPEE